MSYPPLFPHLLPLYSFLLFYLWLRWYPTETSVFENSMIWYLLFSPYDIPHNLFTYVHVHIFTHIFTYCVMPSHVIYCTVQSVQLVYLSSIPQGTKNGQPIFGLKMVMTMSGLFINLPLTISVIQKKSFYFLVLPSLPRERISPLDSCLSLKWFITY